MSTDPETLAVYAARAEEYARMAEGLPRDALRRFLADLPAGARVLDFGCGPGVDAALMAEAGHRPDPVDASPEMVARARTRGLPARRASFDDPLPEVYDAAWASFSLLHAPRDAFPVHLAALHRAMKPGGLLHLGMKLGHGEGRDGFGRYYTYYTKDDLLDLIAAAGFTVTEAEERIDIGLAGTPSPALLVFARA